MTVEIVNYLKEHAQAGDTVFYDIYTDEEKAGDPDKEDTGLFFFRGEPGAKFAVCNAGGAFAYVGAMQDSFPHALELSKRGYNAFALIYRPGAQTACEDLARAISFIFENATKVYFGQGCVKEYLSCLTKSSSTILLAVGGGSVMDCCKAVSLAARYDGDIWDDFWARPGVISVDPLPLGVIVTVAGTGSECNGGAVITNEEKKSKPAAIIQSSIPGLR